MMMVIEIVLKVNRSDQWSVFLGCLEQGYLLLPPLRHPVKIHNFINTFAHELSLRETHKQW